MLTSVWDRCGRLDACPQMLAGMILETAFQPRMNTDRHGCQGLAEQASFTRRVNEQSGSKSVFIRVPPWLERMHQSYSRQKAQNTQNPKILRMFMHC